MATSKDRLIFEVIAEGKNLKVVQKQAGDVADSVERTNKARERGTKVGSTYHKQEKGIYQTGLSSSKGFSKMAQTIGSGSSGLVGAYATLAANVFAATAAFGALRSAAQVEQLAEGLEYVGLQGGRNLKSIAEGLREITGLAISSEEAMRGVALGASAGFSNTQLEDLTKVARGASLALGRDMGDAMSRLVRGAAKLEPEILDELGIMVRLDKATQDYAAAIGTNVDNLSQYERRMAFINAINEQGIRNFGALADAVDPNAYDILSSSLQDLYKSFVGLLNNGLAPIAEFIASSVPAMLGGVALFGTTISRQLAPSLYNAAAGAAAAAGSVKDMAASKLADLKVTKAFPKGYKEFRNSVVAGTASMEEMDDQQKKLTNSIRTHQRHIDLYEESQKKGVKYEGKERIGITDTASLDEKKQKVQDLQKHQSGLNATIDGGTKAQIKNQEAMAYSNAQLGTLGQGWGQVTEAQKMHLAEQKKGIEGQTATQAAVTRTKGAVTRLTMRLKFLGTAFLNLVPFIGAAMAVFGLLQAAWEKFGPKPSLLSKALDKASESIEFIDKAFMQLSTSLEMTSDEVEKNAMTWKSYAGAVQTAADAIMGFGKAHKTQQTETLQESAKELTHQRRMLKAVEEMTEGKRELGSIKLNPNDWFNDAFIESQESAVNFIKTAKEEIKELEKTAATARGRMDVIPEGQYEIMAMKIRDQADALKQYGKIATVEYNRLIELADEMLAGNIKSFKELDANVINITKSTAITAAAIQSMTDAQGQFQKAVAQLGSKKQTPYDASLEALDGMVEKFGEAAKRGEEVRKAAIDEGKSREQAGKMAATAQKELEDILLSNLELKFIGEKQDAKGLKAYRDYVKAARDAVVRNKAEIKELKFEYNEVKGIVKEIPAFLADQLDLEEAIRAKKQEGLEQELSIKETLLKVNKDDEALQETVLDLTSQINQLKKEQLSPEQRILKLAIAQVEQAIKFHETYKGIVSLRQQEADLSLKMVEAEMELAALKRPHGKRELTPAEQYSKAIQAADTQYQNAQITHAMKLMENALAMELLELQTDLLRQQIEERIEAKGDAARAKMLKMDMESPNDQTHWGGEEYKKLKAIASAASTEKKNIGDTFDKLTGLIKTKKQAVIDVAGHELSLAGIIKTLDTAKAGEAFKNSLLEGLKSASTTTEAVAFLMEAVKGPSEETITKMKEHALRMAELVAKVLNAGLDPESLNKKIAEARAAVEAEFQKAADASPGADAKQGEKMGEKMALMKGMLDPMIANLKQFGPDGELMSAAMAGTMNLAEAAVNLAENWDKGASKMEKAAKIGAVIGQVLAAASNIMQAASKRKIAAIDKEIEAEKKRDGKSRESVKKLAALEAKKEAAKKKAFEQNKKMQIAQTIISTLTGAMGAYASMSSIPWVGPVLAGIAAGAITAVGMATVAMIASQKYDGGGGAAAAPKLGQISMGEGRSNSVNIAGGRGNTGGELAYLRGARGMGTGAHDFRPAFAGRKYRAAGGAAYVVGEQGPELFVPSVPGQVVSNDDAAAATAVGNVNFTINAIDAAGVEEVLVGQRGNIIGMIRESANEYGADFLENVDTETYTDITEGSVYGRA